MTIPKIKYSRYKCSKCHVITKRPGIKHWIRSWCNKTGMFGRLIKQKE